MTFEDKKKAEVFRAFFTAVSNSQINYTQGTQPPYLEAWDEEQNKPSMIQVETFRDLLLHLDCHRSVGPVVNHLRVLREMTDVIGKSLSFYQHFRSTGSR